MLVSRGRHPDSVVPAIQSGEPARRITRDEALVFIWIPYERELATEDLIVVFHGAFGLRGWFFDLISR